jgi:hypothetical protein
VEFYIVKTFWGVPDQDVIGSPADTTLKSHDILNSGQVSVNYFIFIIDGVINESDRFHLSVRIS